MTLSKFALSYSVCKKDELRDFIAARTGSMPSKSKRKPLLVEKLQSLDAAVTFRFMDLPPELRMMVYREVLTLKSWEMIEQKRKEKKKQQTCWTGILATCSTIRTEAQDVLYGDTEVVIKLEFQMGNGGCNIYCYDRMSFFTYLWFKEHTYCWQGFLQRVRRLRILIEYPNHWPYDITSTHKAINRFVYGLATHLDQSTEMTSLAVSLKLDSMEVSDAKSMLWPLARFRTRCQVTVADEHEHAQLAVVESYLAEAEVTKSHKSMKDYFNLVDKAEAFRDAAKATPLRIPDSFAGRFEHCKSLVRSLDYIDNLYEQMLAFSVKALEEVLTDVLVARCAELTLGKASSLRHLAFKMMDNDEEMCDMFDDLYGDQCY